MNKPNTIQEIKNEFPYEELEKDIEYILMRSYGPIDMYMPGSDSELVKRHIDHITSDYQEDGIEVITAKGQVKDGVIVSVFLLKGNI